MKKEINIFFTALMFYTRIPCPKNINHSQKFMDESTRYFPLIGWIVGGSAAAVFVLTYKILPFNISILLSMISSILLTGGFHEDAFADVCDGFGGGWKKQQVLNIMKDSRIGTYGTLGLSLIILLKFILLSEINALYIPFVLIIGHSLSRFAVLTFRLTHRYVRENEDSKAKPMAKTITAKNFIIAGIFGIMPMLLLNQWVAFVLIAPVFLAEYLLATYFNKRIGGYTGDCLGSIQQVGEIVFYLGFIVLWKFI